MIKPTGIIKICKCGCGKEFISYDVAKRAVYIKGHQRSWLGKSRNEETKKKISDTKLNSLTTCRGSKNNMWKGGKNLCTCLECQKNFFTSHNYIGKFCSKKCFAIFRKHEWGEWNRTHRRFGLKWWRELRKNIIERDGYCQKCGSFEKLCVHHIIPYREFCDNSKSNLITLCKSCHMKEEKYYLKNKENLT